MLPFRFYPMRKRKFQKNSKNIQKIKKNTIMTSFHAKIDWKGSRKGENKNYCSIPFQPDA